MRITIRGSVFETNSSSEHAFMHLSKEMFEKWRRGEVKIRGGGYIYGLTDDRLTVTEEIPDTVYGPQTDEYPEEEWLRKPLDAMDNPEMKADLLYVMRKYFIGKEYIGTDLENWDGSYVSMLLIYLRHNGGWVSREDANEKYVDSEEWGLTYDDALAAFRKALYEIEEWEGIDDEKYAEFRKTVNDLREKEEITDSDIMVLWKIIFSDMIMIQDEKLKAFVTAFDGIESYDSVYQNAYMDIEDDGKNVRIHTWGRYNG